MKNKTIVLFSFFLMLVSCKEKILDRTQYEDWFYNSENLLKQTSIIGDYTIDLIYIPAEFQYLQSYKENQEDYKDIINSYNKNTAFILRISHNEYLGNFIVKKTTDEIEYSILKKYVEFDLRNKIKLICNTDTVDCVIYQRERSYGLTPYISSTVVFNETSIGENIQVVINDNKIGFGKVKFSYPKANITQLPKLRQ